MLIKTKVIKMEVTAQIQYENKYPVNGIDARLDNIVVRKSAGHRKYGYELYNRRCGKSFFWYRYKRDAVKKVAEMKTYQ
jgi:hypothetical protein